MQLTKNIVFDAYNRSKCLFKQHSYFTSLILFSLYYFEYQYYFDKVSIFLTLCSYNFYRLLCSKKKNKPNALILHCIHEKISFPIAMCMETRKKLGITQISTNKFYSTLR